MSRVGIVALGGSLAQHSTSLSALKVALEGARDFGAEVQLFDLRELNLPMFVPGLESVPVAARELCDAVHAAQGLLWSSPLYHGTVSGSFKNALDWLQLLSDRKPPYLTDKVVGLISTAGGTHGLQAVNTHGVCRARSSWMGRAAGAADSPGVAGIQGRQPGRFAY
jgi:FMN reductase